MVDTAKICRSRACAIDISYHRHRLETDRCQPGRVASDARRAIVQGAAPMIDWWSETDHAILECLRETGPMSPEDLSHRTGLSVGEITAFLAMLVREGRVRVRMVELAQEEGNRLNWQGMSLRGRDAHGRRGSSDAGWR